MTVCMVDALPDVIEAERAVEAPSRLKLTDRLISDPWKLGKIGRRQEGRINVLHQLAIFFGLGFHGLPFRIVLEGFPVRGRRLAARMLQNVKERAAFHGLVQRLPVANTFAKSLSV